VVVRGPTLMSGYWARPQDSAQALRGGWMHTGDMGRLDDEGYLYIVDRRLDVINSGGENVYPRMVEEVLLRHPAVADAVVIGVPDARWGESVRAVVVVRDGQAADGDDILAFAARSLAGFQRPRSIEFRAALPYTTSGKVMRRVLREPHWSGIARGVSGA